MLEYHMRPLGPQLSTACLKCPFRAFSDTGVTDVLLIVAVCFDVLSLVKGTLEVNARFTFRIFLDINFII